MLGSVKTLLLNGAVEALNVRLIVFLPYAAVSVCNAEFCETKAEKLLKLWTVIGLHHAETKWSDFHCSPHERNRLRSTDFGNHFRICPSGEQINDGVHVYPCAIGSDDARLSFFSIKLHTDSIDYFNHA